jgi:hypothetical protein
MLSVNRTLRRANRDVLTRSIAEQINLQDVKNYLAILETKFQLELLSITLV